MIYEKVVQQKFVLHVVNTVYHMIIFKSCLALRIIYDCWRQVLPSFRFVENMGAIPVQVYSFAFSLFEQLEAILDSFGFVNRNGYLNSNISVVFI